jgi:pyrimidine operon attenuation protein/uracil phosphoribosyltransferase
MTAVKNYILDQATAEKKMRRMALEILENNAEEKSIILAGIRENGTVVAQYIRQIITAESPVQTSLISISLDKRMPGEVVLSSQEDFNDKVIIVMDDVANSGKTLLYAMKPFLDFHPKSIQALVLVARSHNSFPVLPDYIGMSVATTLQEHIFVEVENETVKGAYLQ